MVAVPFSMAYISAIFFNHNEIEEGDSCLQTAGYRPLSHSKDERPASYDIYIFKGQKGEEDILLGQIPSHYLLTVL